MLWVKLQKNMRWKHRFSPATLYLERKKTPPQSVPLNATAGLQLSPHILIADHSQKAMNEQYSTCAPAIRHPYDRRQLYGYPGDCHYVAQCLLANNAEYILKAGLDYIDSYEKIKNLANDRKSWRACSITCQPSDTEEDGR